MDKKSILALIFCAGIFAAGFASNGNVTLFFNVAGLLIVLGGTLGATIASFHISRLGYVLKVVRTSYRSRVKTPEEIVEILVDLSVKSKLRGLHTLAEDEAETSIMFLRRALGFVVDNYAREQTREILHTEMSYFKHRRDESERVLRVMADICPAIGLAGSVVGLIGMLAGVEDTSVVLSMIPIALTSTLYGVLFANFFLLPMAARVRDITNHELLLQKIIIEGVLAIQTEQSPRVLEMKLKSFLTPASREGRLVSLTRIKERFQIKDREPENELRLAPENLGPEL